MNKRLELFSGGHKFHNEDFTHLQAGVEETFTALIDGIDDANNTFRMYGADITKTFVPPIVGDEFWTWNIGVGVINGEILKIVPQTIALPTDGTWGLYIEETPLASNPVIYRDGASRNVHLVRTIVAKEVAVAGVPDATFGDFFAGQLPAFFLQRGLREKNYVEILQRAIAKDEFVKKLIFSGSGDLKQQLLDYDFDEDFVNKGWSSSDLTLSGTWADDTPPLEVKKTGNLIEFRGAILGDVSAINLPIFNLDSGFRPTTNRYYRVVVGRSTTGFEATIKISPSGLATVETTTIIGTNHRIHFDDIKFWI